MCVVLSNVSLRGTELLDILMRRSCISNLTKIGQDVRKVRVQVPCCRQYSVTVLCVISGFRHEVTENCVLPGYYAASSGNFLPTFRDSLSQKCEKGWTCSMYEESKK